MAFVLASMPLAGKATERITPIPDGAGSQFDHAGSTVALLGDTAAVGAPHAALPVDSPFAPPIGLVEVYRQMGDAWHTEAVLSAPDASSGSDFGKSLALGQDLLVVGAANNSINPSIYTYARTGSTWQVVDEMPFPTPGSAGSLSLSADTLAVSGGAIYVRDGQGWRLQAQLQVDDPEQIGVTAVDGDLVVVMSSAIPSYFVLEQYLYLYARSGDAWMREAKFDLGPTGLDDGDLVSSVALSGDTALAATAAGVHALVRDADGNWSIQGMLDPGADPAGYGASLALRGDRAVVGSPSDELPGLPSAGTAYVFSRSGGAWTREAHFAAPDVGDFFYAFGTSVAMGDSELIVGAPNANTRAGAAGNADVFTFADGNWTPTASLDFGDAHRGEAFGRAVAASGATLLVGAPDAPWITPWVEGAAYVLERTPDGWAERARLVPSTTRSQLFGAAVALGDSADAAVVGAAVEDPQGAVYVFTRGDGTWPQQARLAPEAASGHDYFGYAVALAGDLLAVGAPRQVNAYGGANAPGYVDLFGRSGAQWVPGGSLQAPDGTAADEFGFAVSMADGRLAVGAPRADQGIEFDAGAVYVFRDDGGTWSEEAELTAPLPAQHAQFGVSVALGDAIAVVGAGDEDPFSGTRGGAYVYGRTGSTWMLLGELIPPGTTPGSFGRAVAVSADGRTILVGAPAGASPDAAGLVYRFDQDGADWNWTQTLRSWSPPGRPPDAFGSAIAIDANDAFVGAPSDGAGGAAYVLPLGNSVFADGFEMPPP